MKILYAIQGTGNGHLARALEVVPALMCHGDVDLLVSGAHCEITLPWPIKYRMHGLGFVFGKSGGIDYMATFKQFKPARFFEEMRTVPVADYDLVVNDFEPLTAWACLLKRVRCVGLSHQRAVMGSWAPRPFTFDLLGALVLRFYAPCRHGYGFHFDTFDEETFTPVIREDIRRAVPTVADHYTVYLPAYDDAAIVAFLSNFPNHRFEVFSKHNAEPFEFSNGTVKKVDKVGFAQSLLSSIGVFCNAGFETPAETLYLKKKLCVIPMHGQYEQQCNAFALQKMGVPVIKGLGHKHASTLFAHWLASGSYVKVEYRNQLNNVVENLIAGHGPHVSAKEAEIAAGWAF